MALWKISSKSNWNWGKDRQLVKGMFIEMVGSSSPLGVTSNREKIADAFNSKYSLNLDPAKCTPSYFVCEKIG